MDRTVPLQVASTRKEGREDTRRRLSASGLRSKLFAVSFLFRLHPQVEGSRLLGIALIPGSNRFSVVLAS